MKLDVAIKDLRTPCYVVDERLLIKNLTILSQVQNLTGCRILLAQKAFSMFCEYPLIGQYLCGTAASGLYEAKLGHTYMGKETHVFSPAYLESEFDAITAICDHIVFNSFRQWEQFRTRALAANRQCGIRINPERSTQTHAIYDPCSVGSRLGVTRTQFRLDLIDGITGLHFHCLCEQNADALETTLEAVEEKFGDVLPRMDWVNFGGGHHITRADYDIERLVRLIKRFQERYGVTVYLEPGEAVALNAGYFVSTVVDIVENGMSIAILDGSAACHMPDVIEMPYRPPLLNAGEAHEKPLTYRLGGPTCLAGDIIGDYSFDAPLSIGQQLVFGDMAIYSMVKNNTFNGMRLPDIVRIDQTGATHIVRSFGYEDFQNRLS